MSVASTNLPGLPRRRILSLHFPRLSTDRIKRRLSRQTQDGAARPERNEPLVVAGKIDNELRVVALDDAAARLGLVEGMPLATARAMHPALQIIENDAADDLRLLNAIADWCDRFTPLVALDGTRGLLLDITGCAHLFGGEAALLHAICQRLTQQGLIVSAALAGTAVAARAVAQSVPGCIVPEGREADAVCDLPVAVLGTEPAITTALRRAGLKTIGEVASRSRHEITARFGAAFTELLQQALGQSDAPISPRRPVPDYVAEQRFAEPVVTSEVLLRTLRKLADVLVGAMERHGKGARVLSASFFRTDGAVRSIAVEAGQAVTDATIAKRLFVERLDALADPLDPGFGFDLVRLAALQTAAVTSTQYGFDTNAHEAADIAAFIDRLSARLGNHRVVRVLPQDTHIPERAEIAVPAQHAAALPWPERITAEPPRRPLRLLAQPERIEVTAEFPHGPPAMFTWRQMAHRLVRTEGPERIAMEWWRAPSSPSPRFSGERVGVRGSDPQILNLQQVTASPLTRRAFALRATAGDLSPQAERGVHEEAMLTRDYFRTEDTGGNRYWIYREGIYDREVPLFRWFMHGLFA